MLIKNENRTASRQGNALPVAFSSFAARDARIRRARGGSFLRVFSSPIGDRHPGADSKGMMRICSNGPVKRTPPTTSAKTRARRHRVGMTGDDASYVVASRSQMRDAQRRQLPPLGSCIPRGYLTGSSGR
jgi:hypothetical protein